MTLADARNENPIEFDAMIREAVRKAADDVGSKVVIAALCNAERTREQRKAA
jgi:hypothetical protein